ncbi:MAG TPA: hypothetical protein VID74_02365 [Gemmatimonadales bacterium]
MPARRDREFSLPNRARMPWWLWIIVAAIHVPVLYLLIWSRVPRVPALLAVRTVALGDSARAVNLPFALERRRATPKTASLPLVRPPAPAATLAQVVASPPPVTSLAALPPAPVDTPPRTGIPSIRPRYGDGRLWVQPLPESPRQLASTLTGQSPAELADSAVARIIQTYLEEMAKERAESPEALPSWTTKIGGKTVGLDQKWIYLGPLKIPTALLALLPIRVQGNMSNYQFNKQLQQMRADLFEAARRSENYDEFKAAVKDLRQQKEREREFKKNQRTRPDSGTHG